MASATPKAVFIEKLHQIYVNKWRNDTSNIPRADRWTFVGYVVYNINYRRGRVHSGEILLEDSFPDVKVIF